MSLLVAAVLVVGFGISRLVGKAALSRLALLPDEQTLFERDGIRVDVELGSHRSRATLGSFVRVTNARVIVGTGKLRRPDRATVMNVLVLDADAGADLGGGPLTDGFLTFAARRADVTVEGRQLHLPTAPDAGGLGIPRRVSLSVDEAAIEPLRNAVVDRIAEPLPANPELPGYRA